MAAREHITAGKFAYSRHGPHALARAVAEAAEQEAIHVCARRAGSTASRISALIFLTNKSLSCNRSFRVREIEASGV